MAERRMMAKTVIETDDFIDMPATSKVLYFYLMLGADDDGFVSNPKSIMRQIGSSQDDIKILLAKKYVIVFDSGVLVIRHWKIHNYIQKDRYKPTTYKEEKQCLKMDAKSHVYELDTDCIHDVSELDTDCIQSGYVGKDRLGKDRLGKGSSSSVEETTTTTTALIDNDFAKIIKFYENNISTVSSFTSERLQSMKDEYTTEWVMHAMERAVEGGRDKSNLRYIDGVLKGWKADGMAKPWEKGKSQKKEKKNPLFYDGFEEGGFI